MSEWLSKAVLWAVASLVILSAVAAVWMVLVGLGGVLKILTNDPIAVLFWAGFIVLGCLAKWGWRKWVG